MKRRGFIKLGASALCTMLIPTAEAARAARRGNLVENKLVEVFPVDQKRHWLGHSFWGNRLQDWQVNQGRIECISEDKGLEVRTVSLLTHSLNAHKKAGRLSMTVGSLSLDEHGYCGFLLGGGAGKLDYRGSALIQRAAGENGGFLAVISAQGELSFRDFSQSAKPLGFERVERTEAKQLGAIFDKEVRLDCHIDPLENGNFDVRFVAKDKQNDEELGFIVRTNVPAQELVGGIMLVSSPPTGKAGGCWWFKDVALGGEKISYHKERQLGPVMGCMHSLNKNVLKLSAQFMPIDLASASQARLDYRIKGQTQWTKGPVENIEDGYVALFRLNRWNFKEDFDYRIVLPQLKEQAVYTGEVVKDPGTSKTLKIALFSCIIPTAKSLDNMNYAPMVPQERTLGRYSPDNILFPHNELVNNCASHEADLYVFCGDQYYETYPTKYGRDTPQAKLDTLYRWYLWYWTFRDLVRNKPSIVLADDHDVLQGNLWGAKGEFSELPKEEQGGFKWDKDLVRMVYRIQHSHNPDPYDPTPIKYNIPVSYGSFVYAGVSFALVEDRKFKSPPNYKVKPHLGKGELLGKRQEAFLKAWQTMDEGLPKICITASIWGSPQTNEKGKGLLDFDSNGYPPDGRARAVKLVTEAKALVLAGDQHLGLIARQGLKEFDDGALFFAGPASAAFWQRWFEGKGKLANQRNNDPNTGDFIDTFGNKMRVLAVANPKLSHQEFSDGNTSWGKFLADRQLKTEGYGIVKVNHVKRNHTLECWEWDTDPLTGKQFDGWPFVTKFDE